MKHSNRRVITSSPVITRTGSITAVALASPFRAFLGVENGLLEEYELTERDDGTFSASLTARKPLLMKVRISICRSEKNIFIILMVMIPLHALGGPEWKQRTRRSTRAIAVRGYSCQ